MLVEMATGQPLFPGDSDTEQLWLILQVGPAWPAAWRCLQPLRHGTCTTNMGVFWTCTGSCTRHDPSCTGRMLHSATAAV